MYRSHIAIKSRVAVSSSTLTALIAALVGGGVAILTGAALELLRDQRKGQQLSHAIAGEISALLEIVQKRGYSESLRQLCAQARGGNARVLKINIQRTYFPVIEANLQNIGLLPVELPLLIPRFLTLSKSVLEDFSSMHSGSMDNAYHQELSTFYDELIPVFDDAIKTGREIITVVAIMYGSPHRRYPIIVRLKMLCRCKWL